MAATAPRIFILVASAIAFIVYIVGFSSPYWLEKEFVLVFPGPAIGVPLPTVQAAVKSNMGLLKSCDETTLRIPNNTKTSSDCGTDGAQDWQKISAGLGIAALVLSFFSVVLSALDVFITKLQKSMMLRAILIIIYFVIVGFTLSCLIIYVVNKKIKVHPLLPNKIDYDLSWAYYVTAASTIMFALLILVSILDIICNFGKSDVDITKERTVAYTK